MSVSPAPGKLGDQFAGPELERYRELFKGARNGNASAVASLLKGGINVNVEGPRGATPLHIAARFDQPEMVSLLLAHGADTAARDARGQTAAAKAEVGGNAEVVGLLRAEEEKRREEERRSERRRCRPILEACHANNVAAVRACVAADPAET